MSVWFLRTYNTAPAANYTTFALDATPRNGVLLLDAGLMCAVGYRNEGSGFATPPTPVASVLQDGTTGAAYSETISAVNGTVPYTFSVASGSLPTGLSLNSSTGVISGTPSATATFTFVIQVTDSGSLVGTQAFTITISATRMAANYITA